MGFDLIFYGALLALTGLGYRIWRTAPVSRRSLRIVRTIPVVVLVLLWAWQIGLLVVPKGQKWHEVLRLPRHLWVLNHRSFPDGAQRQRLTYGEHPRQYYHYYPAPANSPKRDQVIVYWHGGGWTTGAPDQHQYLAHLLQQQGYTLIFPAYRLTPDYHFEDLRADVDAALLHSLDFLKQQGITDPQLILGGTSAGGNLATLLAYDEQRWANMALDRQDLLLGTFSIAGALDLAEMESTIALRRYAGRQGEAQFEQANPKNWVNASDAFPFLCLHGTKDGLVDYDAARSFCQTVRLFCSDCVDFASFDNMTHLQVGAMWYYRPKAQKGQDQTLLQWLQRLAPAPPVG